MSVMSPIRAFALALGLVYLLVGIAGFIPGLVEPPAANAPAVHVHHGHGYLLGLFPVNLLHNLFHIFIGLFGLVGSISYLGARLYARSVALIYGILAILGLIPMANTVFGLIPIHGNDVWLHALTALAAGYFGWIADVADSDKVDVLERPAGLKHNACPPAHDPDDVHDHGARPAH